MRTEKDRIVTGIHELDKIPDPLSRVASAYVFTVLHPDEVVVVGYEIVEFWHELGDNRIEGHIPDISIILNDRDYIRENTKSKTKNFYRLPNSHPIWLGNTDVVKTKKGVVEIIPFVEQKDPKKKQKRVMQHVAPEVDYEVWDGVFFETLLEQYPELSHYLNRNT